MLDYGFFHELLCHCVKPKAPGEALLLMTGFRTWECVGCSSMTVALEVTSNNLEWVLFLPRLCPHYPCLGLGSCQNKTQLLLISANSRCSCRIYMHQNNTSHVCIMQYITRRLSLLNNIRVKRKMLTATIGTYFFNLVLRCFSLQQCYGNKRGHFKPDLKYLLQNKRWCIALWTLAVNTISSYKSLRQNMDAGLVSIWCLLYSSSGLWVPWNSPWFSTNLCSGTWKSF